VVSIRVEDGSRIYLGLSEWDQLRVLNNLRLSFTLLWLLIVLFGFVLIFSISRRLLKYVQTIADTASRIGRSDLTTRVPITSRTGEVAHLALTFNDMLDRIQSSMHQLHTMTDSLAHDLRSPVTAIRGKLEVSLSARTIEEQGEAIISSIEVLDRLSQFLTDSLDVAEAHADALRLTRTEFDIGEALVAMIDLYQPSMAEKNMMLEFHRSGPLRIWADASLIHRMFSNIFDTAIAHLHAGCNVRLLLQPRRDSMIFAMEDNGPGFPVELIGHLFERRAKGHQSSGYGLGLAFVDAVVRAHGGTVTASNCEPRGARITIDLPLTASLNDSHPGIGASEPARDPQQMVD
jgi:signal transduction histidine kinase